MLALQTMGGANSPRQEVESSRSGSSDSDAAKASRSRGNRRDGLPASYTQPLPQ